MQKFFFNSEYITQKKILIFGINRIQSSPTISHIKKIHSLYDEFISCGIDDVLCISFCDFLLFDFFAPKLSNKIKFYQDINDKNMLDLQNIVNKRGHKDFLKKYWQFACLLDKGKNKFYIDQPFFFDKELLRPDTKRQIYSNVEPEKILKLLKQ